MPSVLLATFNLMPSGEYGGSSLVSALEDRGIDARWACWDDPAVDWDAADLIAVRSTWDYYRRLPDFLAWARSLDQAKLLNGAEVIVWNADKSYLVELGERVPVVPTALLDDAGLVAGIEAACARWGSVVIKPRTSGGGIGVVIADTVRDERLGGLIAGPWTVQPLVESVRTVGESSVFVLDGKPVVQVDKLPAGGEDAEIRVHEHFGGSSRAVALDPVRAEAARAAVLAAAELPRFGARGADIAYGRVDLMLWQDQWVVSELEVIEPGLYLEIVPEMAEAFADLVASRLR